MFDFLLITFASCVQCLKIVAYFRHDVFDFIAKGLDFDNDLFGLLADLQILFNLLQRVALFSLFKLYAELINAGFHCLCSICHFDKSLVPFFIDFGTQTVGFQRIGVQL